MPTEEIIDATQSSHGYLVSPLTDHITRTDEGYLVIVGCPIARTGFQEYAVKDLNKKAAAALGVDVSNPDATIDLYRPASEVFAPEFLASLNGKSIVDNHPPQFLNKDNVAKYEMGHIQNPRKGSEPLDDGEWPLIADLIIQAEPLVSKVLDKSQRDISLGYDYGIRRDGDKIVQCDMLGNHIAVVPQGRAGDLVSIQDAAPNSEVKSRAAPMAAANGPLQQGGKAALTSNAPSTKREKQPVKNWTKHLFGRGLRALATDAATTDEELAEAAKAVGANAPPDEDVEDRARDRRARDRRGRDADEDEYDDELAEDRRRGRDDYTPYRAGVPRSVVRETLEILKRNDITPDDSGAQGLQDYVEKQAKAGVPARTIAASVLREYRDVAQGHGLDRRHGRDDDPAITAPEDYDREPADDRRARDRRMHDALDRLLDRHGEDTDLEALKNLLGQYFTEEEAEPEHAATDVEEEPDTSELEEVVADRRADDDDLDGAPEEAVVESGEEELEPTNDRRRARDDEDDEDEFEPADDRHGRDRIAEEDDADEGLECAECGEPVGADDDACPACGCEGAKPRRRARDKRRGKDRATAADGAVAALGTIRPFVARSNDHALKMAFNAALGAATRGSRASSGSYGAFAGAARARSAAPRSRAADASPDRAEERNAKLQAAYDAAAKGGK